MGEHERPDFFDERFTTLMAVQEALGRRGYFFYPIAKEHTEAMVTGPLIHRIETQVKKRGFANLAGKVALTFSGYARDDREVFAIPEVRDYWRKIDGELPELPALLAVLPELGFNGPGMDLMLLGQIDVVLERPTFGRYDVHVVDAPRIIDDATQRIRQAGRKYHLSQVAVSNLIEQFTRGAGYHR